MATDAGVCMECNSKCTSCASNPNFCTACKSPFILNLYDNTCVEECPYGLTVYNPSWGICEKCAGNCKTCEGNIKTCTSCKTNLYLNKDTNMCVRDCGNDKFMVAVDGLC